MISPSRRLTLQRWLQTAIELEFATIPAYLVALLSIQLPGNRAAAERIRSVMVEEMLHLALVANVLTAVGGRPRLDRRAIPAYPVRLTFEGKDFTDRSFPINLAAFSAATMATFLEIEKPQAPPQKAALLAAKIAVPGLTIGDFYQQIVNLIDELDAPTPGALFTGDPKGQLQEDYYWAGGGKVIAVRDAATAKAALDLVIAQGEAAPSPTGGPGTTGFGDLMAMGHYYRFKEIAVGRLFKPGDDPDHNPTGPMIDVDYSKVYPIKTNPTAADYAPGTRLAALNLAFNRRYTAMVIQLQEALTGTPKTLYTAIMDSMHELTPLAHEMMKLPIRTDDPATGCPSFEWQVAPVRAKRQAVP